VGDEREKVPHAADNEPDVEAHYNKRLTEDAPADKDDDDDDKPDVEAHVNRH
jgi:hypothetical protein